MIERKTYYRRKEGKIIAEGKRNNKTIFLFTLPPVEKVAKSSLFTEEKIAKIMEKINRLDYRNEQPPKANQEVRTINIVGKFGKDDFDPQNAIDEGTKLCDGGEKK